MRSAPLSILQSLLPGFPLSRPAGRQSGAYECQEAIAVCFEDVTRLISTRVYCYLIELLARICSWIE